MYVLRKTYHLTNMKNKGPKVVKIGDSAHHQPTNKSIVKGGRTKTKNLHTGNIAPVESKFQRSAMCDIAMEIEN